MTYTYDDVQEIRVAEFILLKLNEAKLILAQADSQTMAVAHSNRVLDRRNHPRM